MQLVTRGRASGREHYAEVSVSGHFAQQSLAETGGECSSRYVVDT